MILGTMRLRTVLIALAALLLLHLSLCAGLDRAMSQPPDVFGKVMMKVPGPAMMVLPFETLWMSRAAGALRPATWRPIFACPLSTIKPPCSSRRFAARSRSC